MKMNERFRSKNITAKYALPIITTFKILSIIVFSLFVLVHSAFANIPEKEQIVLAESSNHIAIPFLNKQVIIDGSYTKDEWAQSENFQLQYITRPFETLPAPVKTEVYVFESGTNLYVLFVATDPDPRQIRAFLRDRDASFGDDLVGVKIDPYNDGRLAYQFYVNPLGVQADSIENEMTGSDSASWNGIWESSGQLTETGFVVEMKIPLRLLNFEESEGVKNWGIEFVRFYPRSDSYRLSHVPFDRNNSCKLCQMGVAKGFKQAKQTNNLAIVPTLVLGQGRSRDLSDSTLWDKQDNQDFGVDVNWSITPEVSLTGTLNPDFSQVEADAAQLNINNTFALFFGERRPFFVENADYFSTNQNLIYTRNINAPDYGAKITGRVDKHSIGFFVANDQTTGFLVPGNLGSSVAQLEETSVNFASRYRYDYTDNLSVGVLSTLRSSDSYQNLVLSLDLRYRITEKDTLRVQLARSDTDYPDFLQADFCENDCQQQDDFSEAALRTQNADGFAGQSMRVFYDRETDNYYINARHTKTDADFRADLGFVSTIDTRKSVIGGGYNWRKADSWWNRIRLRSDWDITHNESGELIEKEFEGYVSIRGNWQTQVEVGTVKRDRVGLRDNPASLAISGNTTRFSEMSHSFFLRTTPNQLFSYRMFVRKGDRVDLANNRLGDQSYFEHEVELNLGKHFRFEIEQTRSRLDANNQALFDAQIYDMRGTYQFDPRQFVRLVVSYSDVDRNQSNYIDDVDANSRNIGLQFLYSYKVNPLTKFFVGLSHGATDNDDLVKLTANNQSVFMKFSYAWLPDF